MRILILIDRFLPEERANAQLYYELARGLVGRGHEVGVVTKMPSGYVPTGPGNHSVGRPPAQERLDGIDVIRIQGLSSLSRALWIRAADQLMAGVTFTLAARRWRGADIVLIYSPPLTLAVAGWLYQKWLGARYVLNLHDIYPQTLIDLGLLKNRVLIRLAEALEAMAYRKAARIVV
ncbi:MAG: glycosyltransferase, partial [Candidatus Binatia bacterium]